MVAGLDMMAYTHPLIAGTVFNKIADHLSHDRVQLAQQCAAIELGVKLRRLPSHVAR